jgi:hypothetical protein
MTLRGKWVKRGVFDPIDVVCVPTFPKAHLGSVSSLIRFLTIVRDHSRSGLGKRRSREATPRKDFFFLPLFGDLWVVTSISKKRRFCFSRRRGVQQGSFHSYFSQKKAFYLHRVSVALEHWHVHRRIHLEWLLSGSAYRDGAVRLYPMSYAVSNRDISSRGRKAIRFLEHANTESLRSDRRGTAVWSGRRRSWRNPPFELFWLPASIPTRVSRPTRANFLRPSCQV